MNFDELTSLFRLITATAGAVSAVLKVMMVLATSISLAATTLRAPPRDLLHPSREKTNGGRNGC
ncbi:hypothetical protein ACSV9I_04515 [Rhizobium sp. G187]|uniref:hypothetical protein n=1 Tax=Rhizobium sp. G187 TaxID=3451352 RepID=UPI003EE7DA51